MFFKILSITLVPIILSQTTDNQVPNPKIVPTSPIVENTSIENPKIQNSNIETKVIERNLKFPDGQTVHIIQRTSSNIKSFRNTEDLSQDPRLQQGLRNVFSQFKYIFGMDQSNFNYHDYVDDSNGTDSVEQYIFRPIVNDPIDNDNVNTQYNQARLAESWDDQVEKQRQRFDESRKFSVYEFTDGHDQKSFNLDYTELILALFVINAVLFIIAYSIKIKRVRQLNRQRDQIEIANFRAGGCREDISININREKEELPILPNYAEVIADQNSNMLDPKNSDSSHIEQNTSSSVTIKYETPPDQSDKYEDTNSTPPSYDEVNEIDENKKF